MKLIRWFLLAVLTLPIFGATAFAQGDPSGAFFAAYQEFQRAERFEREGRNEDAIAKFRYVASQLAQLKSQNPDWQPLVVEFRLRRTQEAIVRLEGSLASPTLGPPPDLATSAAADSNEVLPPLQPPPRRETGKSAPTISISPGEDSGPVPAPTPRAEKVVRTPKDAADGSESEKLHRQLEAEKQRAAGLQDQLTRSEAELTSASMELEKTKVVVVDLTTQLRQAKESSTPPATIPQVSKEELDKLTGVAKGLEETVAAAGAEKEHLAARVAESERKIGDLSAQLGAARAEAATAKAEVESAKEGIASAEAQAESAKAEAAAAKTELESVKSGIASAQTEAAAAKTEMETAKARAGGLEAEREKLVAERDGAIKNAEAARGEVQTLTVRVAELEGERTQLVAARDAAQKEAADAKTTLEKNTELIEANRRLEEKLAAAATQMAGMESDAASKTQVIAGLQADLEKVRTELAGTQSKLKDDRERFDKLQAVNDQLLKEYDEVTGALAAVKLGDVTAAEAKLLQQENEVLRGIIMRQIKEQARREQAYRLAQEEVERLEIRSDTLNDKINELAKPTLELTEAEQEMLKRPVLTLLDGEAAHMTAKVEVLKPKVEGIDQASAVPAASPAASGDQAAEPAVTAASPSPTPSEDLPPELKELVAKARDAFVKGNFSAAEKFYQKIVAQQPDNVVALANLGVAQFRQGKLTAAQLALEKAVKINPSDAFSLTTLGAVMIEQNRSQDAVTCLERANQAVPDDPITLNYLGVASSQLGQFGKAEQSLRRAITVRPEYAEAHFNLAVIYATAKPPSIALAKRHYERALELGSSPDKRLNSMLQKAPGS